jgi:DNA primase
MPSEVDEALRFAERFFQGRLTGRVGGKRAGLYLQGRGYGEDVISEYGLGWAPDSWDALLGAATAEGFSREALAKAGLIKARNPGPPEEGHYDRFRGRLIFPLYSKEKIQNGSPPIGFAGRKLGEEEPDREAPKYINSPSGGRYDKSQYLYGLWRAAYPIESVGTAIVTEGYTDVITLQSEGIMNVVASSGTALTEPQARILSRVASTAVFAYDPDEAGIIASIRGMKRAVWAGMRPSAVLLPEGQDPHEFCRAEGTRQVRSYLEKRSARLPRFMKWAEGKGLYEPTPSLAGELTEIANVAPSEALRQTLLLEASRRIGASDRELFSGPSQPEPMGLAT